MSYSESKRMHFESEWENVQNSERFCGNYFNEPTRKSMES